MSTQSPQHILELHFDGPTVREGRILFDDLSLFVTNLRLAVERSIDVIETGSSFRQGRPPQILHTWSALEVVGIRGGPFTLELDFRRYPAILPSFDAGIAAIEQLVTGLPMVAEDAPLPKGFDQGVLMALRDAGAILDRGIDRVDINLQNAEGTKSATYFEPTREHIVRSIRKLEQTMQTIEGRLLMADVKEGSLHCRIHPSSGGFVWCRYDESLVPLVTANLRHFVQARGEATFDPATNVLRTLFIKDLEPIEEPSEIEIVPAPPSAFWEAKTFDELAMEQEVYPVEDWANFSGGWPEDADFESFLEAIQHARDN